MTRETFLTLVNSNSILILMGQLRRLKPEGLISEREMNNLIGGKLNVFGSGNLSEEMMTLLNYFVHECMELLKNQDIMKKFFYGIPLNTRTQKKTSIVDELYLYSLESTKTDILSFNKNRWN